ncbi:MAG: Arc family DNA-binding protein [Magnetococcales bacterium]|nr:Arc family DNA-binding protein [Magnetococcales bacterium]
MARKKYPSDRFCYNVSFPEGMKEHLKEAAWLNRRSLNAEIIARLEDSLSPGKEPARMDVSDFLDIIIFKLNPLVVQFKKIIRDGKFGTHFDSDIIRNRIFEIVKNYPPGQGYTDANDVPINTFALDECATISMTSNGRKWFVNIGVSITSRQFFEEVISKFDFVECESKKEAEKVFFEGVNREIDEYISSFSGGNVEITSGHMLEWPRELLDKLAPPLKVEHVPLHPLPEGSLSKKK